MPSLFLIDASGYLFRSFYALPPMNSPSGKQVQALHGFLRSITKLIEDFKPDHLVAVFDGKDAKKRRQAIYQEYKSHRAKTPDELIEQIVAAPALCKALGLQILLDDHHEADDLIAAATAQGVEKGCTVYICSADKDLLQLVGPGVVELHTHKDNAIIDEARVKELLGVEPSQVTDWLSLCGDAADNIPGVEGIGPKTAAQLLQKWGSLENLIDNLDDLGPKKKAKFDVEKALISKKLATLFHDFEFSLDWKSFALAPPSQWKPLFTEFGLRSIINSLAPLAGKETEPVTPISKPLIKVFEQGDLFDLLQKPLLEKESEAPLNALSTDWKSLYDELRILPQQSLIHIECFASNFWMVKAENRIWEISFEASKEDVLALRDLDLLWQTSHIQNVHIALESLDLLKNEDLDWRWHDDLVIASHLFYADGRSLDVVKVLEHTQGMDAQEIELLFKQASELNIESGLKLFNFLQQALFFVVKGLEQERLKVYREIEIPLASVLARLHRRGFHVDRARLKELSVQMHEQIGHLRSQIIEIVGETFNLNSPKQLSSMLFDKLGLPVIKKTKTGSSTDNETLLELESSHPVISLLLKYRECEKLRSTYLDALPEFIKEDGNIHPYFEQSNTATGRLSCHQPNLQNIPVRTSEGLMIRSSFTASQEGGFLLSADYSQIELRMMAHLSGDSSLIAAFERGEDIHRYTAALVFEKEIDQVSPEERSMAKAVNFGIIYGQQAFGLSRQIHASVAESSAFIKAYFQRYPGVKSYLEACKEEAKSFGYVKTLMGRRRLIPEIKSPKHMIRQLGERLSINTPVQGSAAELIKMAMIELEKKLKGEPIRMILQVHDELIFEGPLSDLERLKSCIQTTMESILSLKIPLIVNISIGKNWMEC